MKNDLYSYSQDYINRWIISYADFITMLLALFMVMYALSQMNINKLKEFSNSVEQVFDVSPTSQKLEKNKLLKIFSTTEADVKTIDINISDQKNQINQLKNQINLFEKKINQEAVQFKNIENVLEKKLTGINGISVTRESRGLIIRLNDTVLFDAGSDIIKDNARLTLDKLSKILKEIPNSIRVEGHTDNKPINTSKFPSNWELSTSRAINIIKYLINYYKFDPNKLSAVGYGEYMPLKDNSSEKERAANRRVDIVILSSTSKIFEPYSTKVNQE